MVPSRYCQLLESHPHVCKVQKVSFSAEEQLMQASISYRPLERIAQGFLLSQQLDSPGVEFNGLASFDHFTIHSCFLLLVCQTVSNLCYFLKTSLVIIEFPQCVWYGIL